jgi:hypothetical protein
MSERILGPTGSKRRRRFQWMPILAIAALALFFAVGAQAVHDTGAFELDGNATNNPAVVGDDWDNVCHQVLTTDCSTTDNTAGAKQVSWVAEPDRSTSIFTGGGSKDPQDISNWAWKDAGGLPDKDNLQHSFAARYSLAPSATCPAGTATTCELLYFGSDRFDNSGDAQQGFWFFQNKITLGSTPSGGGTSFSGVHKDGDLLIISDFSNGGTTSTISVYKWDSTVSGNLTLLQTSTSANCATSAPGDAFCGLVNATNGTVAPWSFTDKSGNSTYLNGEFYEGGVNLSLLGLAGECFSSVASETRSSTSTTATLKDFVLGQLPGCTASMTTQASATVATPVLPGAAVHDTATLTVAGGANPPDPTGTVTFFLCGPIATGACDSGGSNVGTGGLVGGANTTDGVASAQSPDVNTAASKLASGRYCFRAEWPGDSNYPGALAFTNATDECFAVKDTSTTTTAQNWLPNDSSTVTTGSGAAASGSVTFSLYESSDCSGTAVATFTDTSAPFTTDNTSVYTATKTVSWRAVFTPSDPNAVGGSTSRCERSDLTINNDASA